MSEPATPPNEPTPTPAVPEPNPAPSGDGGAGSGTEGSGGGSQTADAFAEERARLEQRARDFQSAKDKAETELAALKAASTPAATEAQPLTAEGVLSLLERRDAIAAVKASATEQFPNADPSILARASEYESAEALTAALQASDASIKAQVDARLQTEADALVARYREKFGDLDPTPPNSDPEAAGGDPTIEQLAAMSSAEFDAVPEEVIERVMRSASQGGNA